MKIDLTTLLALISAFSVILNLIQAFKRDTKVDAITQSTLSNDMKYVMRGIDDMTLEQKDFSRQQTRMNEEILKNRNETEKAFDIGKRAYSLAEKAHIRLDKMGDTKNEKN